MAGGAGGDPLADGGDGSGAHLGAMRNTPVEINETEVPFLIHRYALVPDSGGAGWHRGGLATELEFEALSPNTTVTARNLDRTRFQGWGLQGGRAGASGRFLLNPGGNREFDFGNTDVVTIGPGDVLRITADGGSGWGNPLDRPVVNVLMDVQRGFVSVEGAARDYGVVIGQDGVDADATTAQRSALAEEQPNGFYDYGDEREAFESVWTETNYDVLTKILSGLPANWRFFVKHHIFAFVDNLAETERKGDGSEVHAAFANVVEDFPQLSGAAG
jgi:N-methylhydantoinase B